MFSILGVGGSGGGHFKLFGGGSPLLPPCFYVYVLLVVSADKCHILHVHYLFYVYVDHWVDHFWSIFMRTARQSVNEIAFSLSLSLSLSFCEIQCTSENSYLRGSLPNSQDSSPLNKGFHRYSIMDMIDLWYKLQCMFSPLEQHSCGKSRPFVMNDFRPGCAEESA